MAHRQEDTGGLSNKVWLAAAKKKQEKVEALRDKMQSLSDEELKGLSASIKERALSGESLDKLLVEAFALVREASLRVTGMEPYPVQILAGIALHEGKMIEEKTGEGKSLVAVLPSYLNALTGKGVHIVTVNDYLAKRDAESIGKIHEFLGMSVGVVTGSSTAGQRKEAYACDVTYVTNAQLGFDWLRDNMAQDKANTVLRGLEYAIIDEADSILIDEARTPLIISGEGTDVSRLYIACDVLAKSMERGYGEFSKIEALMGEREEETGDFVVHEKDKTISLTEQGVKKAEEFFRLEHYGDVKNTGIQRALNLALRANWVMEKDKDYIVRDGKVEIVDEFTGRIMPDRQYSDGMHQAIEAKEGVEVREETRTVASTTYQMFFARFKKKAGMTGTAWTEKKEFRQTYRMRTVAIPTNKPMIREDKEDVVYMTTAAKYAGVIKEILASHQKGQPVLVGTASVEASEDLSRMLRREGITHQVLNAKQDKKEAEIIAQAGKAGTVTIATNMAGRGTDIILDEESVKAGGLKVIGTERHESRRIDNQLRGRAGRQGDPGESVFLVSMEDRVIRLYAPERMLEALKSLEDNPSAPLEHRVLGKAVRKAQKNIENERFQTRKSVLEYDQIDDKQREAVYSGRAKLLEGEDCSKQMQAMMDAFLAQLAKEDIETVIEKLKGYMDITAEQEGSVRAAKDRLAAMKTAAAEQYGKKKEKMGEDFPALERFSILRAVDIGWKEQLSALEYLQQAIGYNAFAQNDPKTVYALEAYKLYGKMKELIRDQAVLILFHASIVSRPAVIAEGGDHETD